MIIHMRKFFIIGFIFFLAASIFVVICKDMAVKAYVEDLLKRHYDLELRMAELHIGIKTPVIHIKGLVLLNPKGFPDPIMLDMPEIFIKYDPSRLFGPRIHLYEMRLNLKECLVAKDRLGHLNVDSLKLWDGSKRPKGKPSDIHIDKLRLKIGKASYKDYTKGLKPAVREFNIDIDEEYADVEDIYTLGRLIVARSLSNTFIPRLADFDVEGLNKTLRDVIKKSERLLEDTETAAKGIVKDAKATLGEVASGIKGALTETFGRKKE